MAPCWGLWSVRLLGAPHFSFSSLPAAEQQARVGREGRLCRSADQGSRTAGANSWVCRAALSKMFA